MNTKKPRTYIKYKGKKRLLSTLCKEKDVNYDMVRKRIKRENWDIERALTTPPKYNKENYLFFFNGEAMSLPKISKLVSIPTKTLRNRINSGMSLYKAITKIKRGYHIYKGKIIHINTLAKISGLNRRTITTRLLTYKWSVEKAVETKPHDSLLKYKYKGKLTSVKEISKKTNISRSTLERYLFSGYTVDEILNNPPEKRFPIYLKVDEKDEKEQHLPKLCKKYNKPYQLVWNRIFNYGWSEKKALETEIDREYKYQKNNFWVTLKIDGKKEKRILSDWCRIFNMNTSLVHKRIKYFKWDPYIALTKPPRKRKPSKTKIEKKRIVNQEIINFLNEIKEGIKL